jgi:hypothetical protein
VKKNQHQFKRRKSLNPKGHCNLGGMAFTQRVMVNNPLKVDSSCIAEGRIRRESEQEHGRILNDSDLPASHHCAAVHHDGAKSAQIASQIDVTGMLRRTSF